MEQKAFSSQCQRPLSASKTVALCCCPFSELLTFNKNFMAECGFMRFLFIIHGELCWSTSCCSSNSSDNQPWIRWSEPVSKPTSFSQFLGGRDSEDWKWLLSCFWISASIHYVGMNSEWGFVGSLNTSRQRGQLSLWISSVPCAPLRPPSAQSCAWLSNHGTNTTQKHPRGLISSTYSTNSKG